MTTAVPCPRCGVAAGEPCRGPLSGMMLSWVHLERTQETPPPPADGAEEAVTNGVAPSRGDSGRPDRCANCSQPLGYGTKVLGNVVIGWHCGDCWSSVNLWDPEQSRTLDQRIREAQTPDRIHCAWATPTGDGESW